MRIHKNTVLIGLFGSNWPSILRRMVLLIALALMGCSGSHAKATCDSSPTQQALLDYFRESLGVGATFWSASNPRLISIKEHSPPLRLFSSCSATLELDVESANIDPERVVVEIRRARDMAIAGLGSHVTFNYPDVQRGLPDHIQGRRLRWNIRYEASKRDHTSPIAVDVENGEAIVTYVGYYASLSAANAPASHLASGMPL